jgi:hypothetical protein
MVTTDGAGASHGAQTASRTPPARRPAAADNPHEKLRMQPDPHGFLALLFRLSMHFDVGG